MSRRDGSHDTDCNPLPKSFLSIFLDVLVLILMVVVVESAGILLKDAPNHRYHTHIMLESHFIK